MHGGSPGCGSSTDSGTASTCAAIHYVVSQSGGLAADGTPYLNDHRNWVDLSEGSRKARYLGLVDPETCSPTGATDATIHVQPCFGRAEPDVEITRSGGVYVPGLPPAPSLFPEGVFLSEPEAEVNGYDTGISDQPVLLELWVEKSTVNDVVEPLCAELGLNLKVGKGYESITSAVSLLRRADAAGKPIHVFYVSDLDNAGEGMPIQVARQLEFWAWKLGIDIPVTLERLALTVEQVEEYSLPQAPASGDTELDALEALHPGELERVIREAVEKWRDPDLDAVAQGAQDEAEQAVKQALEAVTAEVEDDVDDLAGAVREIRARYLEQLRPLAQQWQQISGAYKEEIAGHEETAGDLEARLNEAVEGIDWDLPERPEAEPPDVDTADLLYDSERDWLDQIGHYHAARRSR